MAAAKILFFFIAATTRFFHPVIASEKVEGFRLIPDLFNAVVFHIGVN